MFPRERKHGEKVHSDLLTSRNQNRADRLRQEEVHQKADGRHVGTVGQRGLWRDVTLGVSTINRDNGWVGAELLFAKMKLGHRKSHGLVRPENIKLALSNPGTATLSISYGSCHHLKKKKGREKRFLRCISIRNLMLD